MLGKLHERLQETFDKILKKLADKGETKKALKHL